MGPCGGGPEHRPGRRHRPGRGAGAPAGRRARGRAQEARLPMTLLIENRGAVRVLTLNRPEKRNALNTELTKSLLEAIRAADADESVGALVLTGAGPGFCAGADLSEFKGLKDPEAAATRAELTMQLHLVFSKVRVPVVTAINGAAMGG